MLQSIRENLVKRLGNNTTSVLAMIPSFTWLSFDVLLFVYMYFGGRVIGVTHADEQFIRVVSTLNGPPTTTTSLPPPIKATGATCTTSRTLISIQTITVTSGKTLQPSIPKIFTRVIDSTLIPPPSIPCPVTVTVTSCPSSTIETFVSPECKIETKSRPTSRKTRSTTTFSFGPGVVTSVYSIVKTVSTTKNHPITVTSCIPIAVTTELVETTFVTTWGYTTLPPEDLFILQRLARSEGQFMISHSNSISVTRRVLVISNGHTFEVTPTEPAHFTPDPSPENFRPTVFSKFAAAVTGNVPIFRTSN